jgi:hypothetical protein
MLKDGGLVSYPKSNFDNRKLLGTVVTEFIDFMDDHHNFPRNQRVDKDSVFQKFKTIYTNNYGKIITSHTFTKWLKQYIKTKGLTLNPKQGGKYDKSNGIEFYTISDEHNKVDQLTIL